MGSKSKTLSEIDIEFIRQQKIFYVATAANEGFINLSPKGLDSLRITTPERVHWLNLTGSGNETAAHSLEDGRITLMFCSFDKNPLILRIYGKSRFWDVTEDESSIREAGFDPIPGARQLFEVEIEMVQRSCGFGVPRYEFIGERETLVNWAQKKGKHGIRAYQKEKNSLSLDGKKTGIAQ